MAFARTGIRYLRFLPVCFAIACASPSSTYRLGEWSMSFPSYAAVLSQTPTHAQIGLNGNRSRLTLSITEFPPNLPSSAFGHGMTAGIMKALRDDGYRITSDEPDPSNAKHVRIVAEKRLVHGAVRRDYTDLFFGAKSILTTDFETHSDARDAKAIETMIGSISSVGN